VTITNVSQQPTPIEEEVDALDQVIDLLDDDDAEAAIALLSEMRPAEAAVILEQLSGDDLAQVVSRMEPDVVSSAIEYATAATRTEIARHLDAETLTETLESISDDIAADMVQEMGEQAAADAMDSLSDERRGEIEQLLSYGDETAGGRMTGQVITVAPDLTASGAIQQLRDSQADASKPFYLYVTSPDRSLLGVINVRALITAQPGTQVRDLMTSDVISVEAETDQEEAAHILQRHNLLALPVVNNAGHLLGTITSDDLIDVLEEEATEDLFRLALVHEDEDLRGVWSSVRNRLPWLTVNLVTAMAAAFVVAAFENTLAQVAILAAFLPVIGGQGGNAGIQTLTVVIRSLAIERISPRDTPTLLLHEMWVGLIVGIATGLMVGVVALIWRGNPWLGLVVLAALAANTLVGALSGVVIPMALQRLKQDPALSGGIWLTTATDLSGFFAFLGTATLLIDRLK
jgi:magnesium transporter